MLVGHSVPRHYIPSWLYCTTPNLGRTHLYTTGAAGGLCQPATQNLGTTLHLGRIHLQTIAAKEGSVNRLLSIQALYSTSAEFNYMLQPRRRAAPTSYSTPSLLVGFTYVL